MLPLFFGIKNRAFAFFTAPTVYRLRDDIKVPANKMFCHRILLPVGIKALIPFELAPEVGVLKSFAVGAIHGGEIKNSAFGCGDFCGDQARAKVLLILQALLFQSHWVFGKDCHAVPTLLSVHQGLVA